MRQSFTFLLPSRKVLISFVIGVSFLFPQEIFATVVINEFQVEPSGSSQWTEIFNTGPDGQDISGWFIDDNGGTEKYTIPSDTVLGANNCISFSSGSFNWNTSTGDSARLLNGTTVVDEYAYSGSPGSGVSFGRSTDGTGSFITFSSPTRDQLNANGSSCLASPTPTPTPTSTPTQTVTPSPTPTPTHTVSPTPTKTPTPTPTVIPTKTPTPSPTPTKTPTPTSIPTPSPTSQPTPTPTEAPEEAPDGEPEVSPMVLGESSQRESSPSAFEANKSWKSLVISLLFVATGSALLAGLYAWRIAKRKLFDDEVNS